VMGTRCMVVAVLAALAGLTACDGRNDDQDRVRLDAGDGMAEARAGWSPAFEAAIDSGNAAYREGRWDDAADHFRQATELEPQVAAAWFGLHMAESARGNEAEAFEALQRAEALTPGLGGGHPRMPDDSPHGGLSPHDMDLPPGHPTMTPDSHQ
jgi:tetratricopeptide (TPR) repeat protein